MKREKNFYFNLIMIVYIMAYTSSLILACRMVDFANLKLTAAVIVYPITYFLLILVAERYDKEKARMMLNYAVIALIIMVLFITLGSVLPIYNGKDGLDVIFNIDFRIVFASIASFYLGQYLCLEIYYYLSGFKGFKFLMAGVIAITIDTLVFTVLSLIGNLPFSTTFATMIQRFTSQYIFDVIMIIIYSIIFTYIIDTVVKTKPKEKEISAKKATIKKDTTKKKSSPKKNTKK